MPFIPKGLVQDSKQQRGEAHLSSAFPQEPGIAEPQWAPSTVLNTAGRNCVVLEKHRLRNPKTEQNDSSVAEQCECSMEAASQSLLAPHGLLSAPEGRENFQSFLNITCFRMSEGPFLLLSSTFGGLVRRSSETWLRGDLVPRGLPCLRSRGGSWAHPAHLLPTCCVRSPVPSCPSCLVLTMTRCAPEGAGETTQAPPLQSLT